MLLTESPEFLRGFLATFIGADGAYSEGNNSWMISQGLLCFGHDRLVSCFHDHNITCRRQLAQMQWIFSCDWLAEQ